MNKGVVRSSKFRHVFGKTLRKEDHYENIQSNVSAQDSNLCDANAKYFAVPWRGGGGPFVVWPLNKPGRLPQNVPLIAGKAMHTCEDHPDAIHAFDWNFNGSLYGTYCKDKFARIIDPRANHVVAKFNGHQGLKGARFTFLGDRPMFATIGFSKQSERQIFFWDQRSPDSPLTEVQLDIASGSLLPIFDPDTNLLFLAGKGDTTIRYFEIEDTEPYQYFVNQFQAKEPQRGVAVISKRAVDVANNEIIRVLRLTQSSMEPVCFEVPRKGEHFHLDLYPDTFAGKPSLTSKEWFSGKNAAPVLMSMDPKDNGTIRPVVHGESSTVSEPRRFNPAPASAPAPAPAPAAPQNHHSSHVTTSGPSVSEANHVNTAKVAHLENKVKELEVRSTEMWC
eukprot:753461-Hanusia_phi.AAC.10